MFGLLRHGIGVHGKVHAFTSGNRDMVTKSICERNRTVVSRHECSNQGDFGCVFVAIRPLFALRHSVALRLEKNENSAGIRYCCSIRSSPELLSTDHRRSTDYRESVEICSVRVPGQSLAFTHEGEIVCLPITILQSPILHREASWLLGRPGSPGG